MKQYYLTVITFLKKVFRINSNYNELEKAKSIKVFNVIVIGEDEEEVKVKHFYLHNHEDVHSIPVWTSEKTINDYLELNEISEPFRIIKKSVEEIYALATQLGCCSVRLDLKDPEPNEPFVKLRFLGPGPNHRMYSLCNC